MPTAFRSITWISQRITDFAVLVSHSKNVVIDHVSVKDSGSLNAKGRNNTTGGILLEEGTEQFTVADSVFRNIRGNGGLDALALYGAAQSQRQNRQQSVH